MLFSRTTGKKPARLIELLDHVVEIPPESLLLRAFVEGQRDLFGADAVAAHVDEKVCG